MGMENAMSGFTIFWMVWLVFALACGRMFWANSRTRRDRHKFTRWARRQPNRDALMEALDDVEYDEHMWALYWGRDPWPLYQRPTTDMVHQ
jgi:hypothetical protein